MLKKLKNWLKRNPCRGCKYYFKENNSCQSKKCITGDGRTIIFDRLFCETYTGEIKGVGLDDDIKRVLGS